MYKAFTAGFTHVAVAILKLRIQTISNKNYMPTFYQHFSFFFFFLFFANEITRMIDLSNATYF